jgi:hypothetical protein
MAASRVSHHALPVRQGAENFTSVIKYTCSGAHCLASNLQLALAQMKSSIAGT